MENYAGIILLIGLIFFELYSMAVKDSKKTWHLLMIVVWVLGILAILKFK
jgi:cytochrome c oxidase assembly factor CtaG